MFSLMTSRNIHGPWTLVHHSRIIIIIIIINIIININIIIIDWLDSSGERV